MLHVHTHRVMLILTGTSQKGTQMSDLLMGELPSEPVFRYMIFYNVASYNFAWTYFFGNKIHLINFLCTRITIRK